MSIGIKECSIKLTNFSFYRIKYTKRKEQGYSCSLKLNMGYGHPNCKQRKGMGV